MMVSLSPKEGETMRSDADLMEAFYAGNNEALSELFARYRERLLAFFRSRGLQTAAAEDRLQETLVQVLASRRPDARHRFDPHKGAVAAWLFTAAYHQVLRALDERERAQKQVSLDTGEDPPPLPSADPEPDEAFWTGVQQQAVQACLCQLPDERQRLAVQRWLETEGSQKLRELAEEMGVAVATAQRRREAAFEAMRQCLEEAGVGGSAG
jgi:RNA polymerase sigma factor (sigma-70 family)